MIFQKQSAQNDSNLHFTLKDFNKFLQVRYISEIELHTHFLQLKGPDF